MAAQSIHIHRCPLIFPQVHEKTYTRRCWATAELQCCHIDGTIRSPRGVELCKRYIWVKLSNVISRFSTPAASPSPFLTSLRSVSNRPEA
uniref:Uncharacterized protein n=1 Tax=Physcomitrium patens TaxID=3218 RepID=A0A2K1JG67_PHYPA|nr:hypothetical protein PHYPA_017933 [Physcomitrium patens]